MAQFPKQFINLIGAILVIAVIVAGILLLAVPLFVNASQTGESSQSVAASNAAYAVRVATLEAESDRIDEIESDLAELRAEIPAASDLDDVFEIVATAAQQAGVTVVSATASTSEPWTARSAAV
jgi:Tfp pilus assembly protein PilO